MLLNLFDRQLRHINGFDAREIRELRGFTRLTARRQKQATARASGTADQQRQCLSVCRMRTRRKVNVVDYDKRRSRFISDAGCYRSQQVVSINSTARGHQEPPSIRTKCIGHKLGDGRLALVDGAGKQHSPSFRHS